TETSSERDLSYGIVPGDRDVEADTVRADQETERERLSLHSGGSGRRPEEESASDRETGGRRRGIREKGGADGNTDLQRARPAGKKQIWKSGRETSGPVCQDGTKRKKQTGGLSTVRKVLQ